MSPEQQIEAFWFALEHSWDIEPRSYFEEAAPRNGFSSPLAMAVHYMWKREPKVRQAEEAAKRLHRLGGMIRGGANYEDMRERAKADMAWVEKEF